MLFMRYGGNIM